MTISVSAGHMQFVVATRVRIFKE